MISFQTESPKSMLPHGNAVYAHVQLKLALSSVVCREIYLMVNWMLCAAVNCAVD